MSFQLIAKSSVQINAPASEVWDALTKPELIKQYFFGTETTTDWQEGSPITFKGEWEGKPYEDKGTILAIEPGKSVRYNYLSSLSDMEDIPENYANITYDLSEDNGVTTLTISQDHIETDEKKTESEGNWNYILNNLKEMLEK